MGVAGVVCDGAVRDTGTLGGWDDFAVYSRWINPRGPSSAERGAVNLPVMIGGTRVAPGDLVIGDDDGLVVLTPQNAKAFIADAEAKLLWETSWTADLAAGTSAVEVFGLAAAVKGVMVAFRLPYFALRISRSICSCSAALSSCHRRCAPGQLLHRTAPAVHLSPEGPESARSLRGG